MVSERTLEANIVGLEHIGIEVGNLVRAKKCFWEAR